MMPLSGQVEKDLPLVWPIRGHELFADKDSSQPDRGCGLDKD